MPTKSSSQTEKTNFSLPEEFFSDVSGVSTMDTLIRDPQIVRQFKNVSNLFKNLPASSIRNSETSSPFTTNFSDCVTNQCPIEEIVSDSDYFRSDGVASISGQKRKSSTQLIGKFFQNQALNSEYGDVEESFPDSEDTEFQDDHFSSFVKSPCSCEYCANFVVRFFSATISRFLFFFLSPLISHLFFPISLSLTLFFCLL